MELSEQLRQRILRSLRWLVEDARWRFDENKGNLDPGSHGGYSAELKEAIELLQVLEQQVITIGVNGSGITLQDCIDTGWSIGLTEEESRAFYAKYTSPLLDLKSAMNWWKLNKHKTDNLTTKTAVKLKSGLTPLQQYYNDREKQK